MSTLLPRRFRTAFFSALASIASVSLATDPGTGEWTTFGNGPSHTGFYPKRIGTSSFAVGWSKTLPSRVNQVAVSGDTIYATTNGYFNAGMRAFAMKVSDGTERWSFPLADAYSVNPPTYANGRVYFQRGNHGDDTHLWCLDAVSGTLIFAAPHTAQWERYAAPTVADGGAFVNGGYYGGMYGFDATTGTQRFFINNLAQEDGWTPSYANGVVYSCVSGIFTAYDPKSGSQLWSRDLKTTTTGTSTYWYEGSIPVISDNKAFIIGAGRLAAIDLTARTLLWHKPGNYTGTPALAEGRVYAFLGSEVRCYEATNGTELGAYVAGGTLMNQPLVTKDLVLVSNGTNTSIFDRSTFALRQTLTAGGNLSYASGRLYVVSDSWSGPSTLATFSVTPEEADPPAEPLPPGNPPEPHPNPDRPLGTTTVAWIDSVESGGISYFLFGTPAKIERYDLGTGNWLKAISLPDGPKGFTVSDSSIYVSFGKSISKFPLDGTTETPLTTTATDIRSLFELKGKLYLGNEYGSGFFVVDPVMGNFLGAKNFSYSQGGISIATSKNKFFGRTTGVSPSDILSTSINEDGTFGLQKDSPYHGDYPNATKTYVMPGEGRVVDNSGLIYSTGDLSYLGSFAGAFNDIAFSSGSSIVLRGNNLLVAYSPALSETGRKTIGANQERIQIGGEFVHSFARQDGRGVVAAKTALAELVPQTPGPGIDPTNLTFTPDAIEYGDDVVFLLSKLHQSVFRWSISQQRYIGTIPLTEVPQYMAYSGASNRVYLAYAGGRIGKVDLNTGLSESFFANLPQSATGLQAAGEFLFASDASGAWATHYVFAPDGTLAHSVDWTYFSRGFTWSPINRRMYFLRDDTSPNDLIWESIDTEGQIAQEGETPYHGDYMVRHPIRVSPDGTSIVLGNGDMYQGLSLQRLGALAIAQPPGSAWYSTDPAVSDAGWVDGVLFTVSATYPVGGTVANGGRIQRWNSERQQSAVATLPGKPARLIALPNKLLAISIHAGKPTFTFLTTDLENPGHTTPQPHPNPDRPLGNTNTPWIASMEANGIGYFLFDQPAKIERYELSSGTWLKAISLPEGPKGFTVSNTAIYVSFATSISQFPLDGTTETPLITTATTIKSLFEFEGAIYAIDEAGLRFSRIDPAQGVVLHSASFTFSQGGLSFAPTKRTFFGRTIGVSPADILSTKLNVDGSFGVQTDSPSHGIYPDANRTHVMPGEGSVVDNAGMVYSTTDLGYQGSFGGAFTDVAFYPGGSVLLRGDNLLVAYSPTLAETGRKTVIAAQERIYVSGNSVHSFARMEGRGVVATITALAELVPVIPDPDPVPLDYLQVAGTYMGSLTLELGEDSPVGGLAKLSVDTNGRASGFVRIGGKTIPFRVTLDEFGNATVSLKIKGEPATLTLKLTLGTQGPVLTGTLVTANASYALQGARAQQSAAPGRYLFLLTDTHPTVRDEVPPVIGHGALTISKFGAARLTGQLLQGGAVSQGSMLLEDGTVVLNLMTPRGTHTICGSIAPDESTGTDWNGTPRWCKRAAPASRSYPEAINMPIFFNATKYESDRPTLALTPDRGVTFVLEAGDLEEPIFVGTTLYGSGFAASPFHSTSLIAFVDPKTGLARGTFTHPSTRSAVPFAGIVNQNLNQVQGGFRGPQRGGQFRILPGNVNSNRR